MKFKIDPNNPNAGHRSRLRQRFLKSRESLEDYELIEMLLFLAFSRKDTKGLSKMLLDKFGSIKELINCDTSQLKSINGIGDSVICLLKMVQEIYLRMLKEEVKSKKITLKSMDSVVEYVKSKFGYLKRENCLILFLNNASNVVSEEVISIGDIDQVSIYKNFIITHATQNGCKSIILVHNHPSGDPTPSVADITFTKDLNEVLLKLNMKLLDHIIVSGNSSFSFARSKLLKK